MDIQKFIEWQKINTRNSKRHKRIIRIIIASKQHDREKKEVLIKQENKKYYQEFFEIRMKYLNR